MKNVLVVDDEQILTDVLVRFLNRLECHSTVTGTGIEALTAFEIEKFDLVVMDVNLADCDGLDIAKCMIQKNPEQKILIITGQDRETIKRRTCLEEMQMAKVLSKPFSFSQFRSVVLNYVNPMDQ
jgi:CheY-like chemotaxis protein